MFGFFKTKAQKLREERAVVYAQLAELFVQWGGLVPRSTDTYDFDKCSGVRSSIVIDQFAVAEGVLERITRHDELRKNIADQTSMCLDGDPSAPVEDKDKLVDLYRNQAYILSEHGEIGPLPLAWVRHLISTSLKIDSHSRFPRLAVLTNRDPRANRAGKGDKNSNDGVKP